MAYMVRFCVSGLMGAGLLMSPGLQVTKAVAADYPMPPIIEYTPEYEADVGGGWYLRGDIGFAAVRTPGTTYGVGGLTDVLFINESMTDTWTAGAGFGYRFSEFFRTDITADYRAMDYSSNTPGALVCLPDEYCSYDKAKVSALALMVNGYIDMGEWYGITPYIGAGIGTAHLSLNDWVSTGTTPYAIVDRSDWVMAYSLMAGLGVELIPGAIIDIGYRYLNLEDLESGEDANTLGVGTTAWATLNELGTHEFRLGVRYEFN